jgi:hypothetical protein
MPVDTKGFVLTDCKDVLLISNLVGQAIHGLILAECRTVLGEAGLKRSQKARDMFGYPQYELKPDLGMLDISFTFHSEKRSMTLFFDCDSDREAYGPHSISIKLGCFGYSDLFIKTALHALSMLGPVYFDHNDCDDIDFALLEERVPPVLGAVSLDYIKDSRFPDWVEYYDAGRVGAGKPFEAFFGAPETAVREVCAIKDFTARWKAVCQLANTVDATPTFLSEYHRDAIAQAAQEAAAAALTAT